MEINLVGQRVPMTSSKSKKENQSAAPVFNIDININNALFCLGLDTER